MIVFWGWNEGRVEDVQLLIYKKKSGGGMQEQTKWRSSKGQLYIQFFNFQLAYGKSS